MDVLGFTGGIVTFASAIEFAEYYNMNHIRGVMSSPCM